MGHRLFAEGGEFPEGRGLALLLGPPPSDRLSPFTLFNTIRWAFGEDRPSWWAENGRTVRKDAPAGPDGAVVACTGGQC